MVTILAAFAVACGAASAAPSVPTLYWAADWIDERGGAGIWRGQASGLVRQQLQGVTGVGTAFVDTSGDRLYLSTYARGRAGAPWTFALWSLAFDGSSPRYERGLSDFALDFELDPIHDDFYWIEGSTLWRASQGGGPAESLFDVGSGARAFGVDLLNQQIYVISGLTAYRLPLGGGAAQVLGAVPDAPTDLVVDAGGDQLFYSADGIWRCPLDFGSPCSKLIGGAVRHLRLDGSTLYYWNDEGVPNQESVWSIGTDGSDPQPVTAGFPSLDFYIGDYDPASGQVFAPGISPGNYTGSLDLVRYDSNGTGRRVVFGASSLPVDDVAVDVASGLVVYATPGLGRVSTWSDATGRTMALDPEDDTPRFPQAVAVGSTGRVYFSDWTAIHSSDLDGSDRQLLVADGGIVLDLEVDSAAGRLYWSARADDDWKILRVGVDGTGVVTLLDGLTAGLGGIGLDLEAETLYWAAGSEIWRANLDGSTPTELPVSADDPRDVAVDSPNQLLYWTDRGAGNVGDGTIRRSDLDGLGTVTIFDDLGPFVSGMTLVYEESDITFADNFETGDTSRWR